jgi:MHS family alpha-ketoglutarate permease-like MFS transporter
MNGLEAGAPSAGARLTPAARLRAIVASSAGNLVEWYDFYVYSFTALYFAAEFFPGDDPTSQLLSAAGVFAIGFLMRPLGGWLFGRLADRRGRKTSLLLSVLIMCVGSLAIAVLPTNAAIGAAAPFLLLIIRMVQGLALGGEYGATATYMSEVSVAHRRGYYASFQYVTLIGGQLVALLVLVALQQLLPEDAIRAWAWRVPFVIGGVLAIVVLYLRSTLHETVAHTRTADAGTLQALAKHSRALLIVLGLTAGGSLLFYTFTTYMQKYLVNTAGMSAKTASLVLTFALLIYMVMQPVFGLLSDRIGRRRCLLLFGGLATVSTYPLLAALGVVTSPLAALLLVLCALMIISFYTSISGVFKAELFPANVRALGVGLSYAVGNALFGGTAEYVALWFRRREMESGFYIYVSVLSAVAFVTALAMGRRYDENRLD